LIAVSLPWSLLLCELPDPDLLGFTETTSNSWPGSWDTNAVSRNTRIVRMTAILTDLNPGG
jgi:hypothetical protein